MKTKQQKNNKKVMIEAFNMLFNEVVKSNKKISIRYGSTKSNNISVTIFGKKVNETIVMIIFNTKITTRKNIIRLAKLTKNIIKSKKSQKSLFKVWNKYESFLIENSYK